FGTVLLGRMQGGEGADRVLGMFVNTLPVRIKIGEEGTERSVRDVHHQLGELMQHEHAPLALAQRCSSVTAPSPLFTSLLNYRHTPREAREHANEVNAWAGIEMLYGEERTNYPFTLSVDDLGGEGFRLTAQVEEGVGARRVCGYMERALRSLVEALEEEPQRAVSKLEVLPEREWRQIVEEWNATEAEDASDRCVQELIEEQVEKSPAAMAVECGGTSLSYGELNRRA